MAKEWMTVPVYNDIHKALKQKALDDGRKLMEVANEILANALEMNKEAKANGTTAEKGS